MSKLYKHVLLADDDHDDCDIFSEVFAACFPNTKLSISNDGGKLMDHLNRPPEPLADIIFLDLNMPILTGPECLQQIRDSKRLSNHIVIIYTTSSSPDDVERMYALGANFFITKPTDFMKMGKLISKAMAMASATGSKQPGYDDFYITA
ncbi:response regulator [Flavobacterium sp. NRK1]|uniref:response regulator n=1 Tax=Flavobacterium sp. NRK1 TaxID=2954929 RepID=UPI00209362B0|nr:response regulator [Flavobacterium sp. NRK1]MCO6148894.1 response regulator [Flavobacterium sp. NRK1]